MRSVTVTEDLQKIAKAKGLHVPLGSTTIGLGTAVELPIRFWGGVRTWEACRFGAFSYSWSEIIPQNGFIGRYCSIAKDVQFAADEHPTQWMTTAPFTYCDGFWEEFEAERGQTFPASRLVPARGHITIGNDVWIGQGVYIRSGVTIGDGAIIGARSVVTKDVPPYAIAVGNPATIKKYRFNEDTIARLLALKWWRYAVTDLSHVPFAEIDRAMDAVEGINAKPYEPGWVDLHDLMLNLPEPRQVS